MAISAGANQQPSITGLNYIKDVPEDTAIGSTLVTFVVTDDDNPTCLLSASPLESLQYFELDSEWHKPAAFTPGVFKNTPG